MSRLAGADAGGLDALAEALAGAVHRACVRWQRTLEPTEADRTAEWLDRLA